MNGKQYMRGLQYYSDINCSDAVKLRKFLGEDLKNTQYNKKDIILFLNKKIEKLKKTDGMLNQKKALHLLVAKDLEIIRGAAKEKNLTDPEENLPKANSFFMRELEKLGLKAVPHKLEVVDEFPSI